MKLQMNRSDRRRGRARCSRFVAVVGLLALAASAAHGTLTSPELVLSRVDSESGAKGTLVRVEGVFPFDDLVQQAYPLQLFIRSLERPDRFVCFSVPWGVMEGGEKAFEDGLDEDETPLIGRAGAPSKDGRILQVSPRHMRVRLPEKFPSGLAEAQLFVMYNGAPVFSNVYPFEIEDGKW